MAVEQLDVEALTSIGLVVDHFDSDDAWLEHRKHGVGGSDIAAIMGLSDYSTAYDVWLEKTNRYVENFSESFPILKGKAEEPVLREWFDIICEGSMIVMDGTGYSVHDPKHPHLLASLDGVLYDKDTGSYGILECKTAASFKARHWKTPDGEYSIPEYYLTQTTFYMAVTGFSWGYVIADIGMTSPVIIRFERDEQDIQAVVTAAEDFWKKVEDDVIPDVTMKDIDNIQQSHECDNVDEVHDSEYDRLVRERVMIEDDEKNIKQRKELNEKQLKEYIGANRKGVTNGRFVAYYKPITYKPQPEKTVPAKPGRTVYRFTVKEIKEN